MTERITNQPEIIKPKFYLEKIGEDGIEFVEQFLKTPGTLAHSLNSKRKEDETLFFLEQVLDNNKVTYAPYFYGHEFALSLYFTDLDNEIPITSEYADFGIRSYESKGFIIFNSKLNERMRGESYIDGKTLSQLMKYDNEDLFSIAPKLFKVDLRFLKYYRDSVFYNLSTILKFMKGLRDFNNYNEGKTSKLIVQELLPYTYETKYTTGIRMIGFDDDGVLKPLPIRREEIAYYGRRKDCITFDGCSNITTTWEINEVRKK